MFVQVHSRALNVLMSFKTQLPFDQWDVWRDLRALPLHEQLAKLRDPDLRGKLVEVAHGEPPTRKIVGVEARPPDYDHFYVMDSMSGEDRLLRDLARERGMDPVDLMIELGLQTQFQQFFRQPAANENQADVLEMIQHPRSVVTFSDSGAHVSQIMDSSLQTHLLGHWVREQQALSLEDAVRQLTYNPATLWGMHDRGLIREGMNADLVVFDPATVGPEMPEAVNDLPAAAGASSRWREASRTPSSTAKCSWRTMNLPERAPGGCSAAQRERDMAAPQHSVVLTPPATVLAGDCLAELPKLEAECVDLIVTSPPYANQRAATYGGIKPNDYVDWFLPIAEELRRVLKPGGTFILNVKEPAIRGERHTHVIELILALREHGWLWTEEFVWHKKNSYPGKWPNRFRDAWSACCNSTRSVSSR